MSYKLLDAISNVQDDLKDSSFSVTRIRRYLNHGLRVIFATHDFKYSEELYSNSLSISDTTLTLPLDHESTIKIVLFDPSDNRNFYVFDEKNFVNPRDFFSDYPKASAFTSGLPSCWTEYGGLTYFNLPVDKAYDYSIWYHRYPTALSGNDDVPELPESYCGLLELWADYRGEKYRGNHDIAATYKQEFEDELESIAIKHASIIDGPTITRQTRVRV